MSCRLTPFLIAILLMLTCLSGLNYGQESKFKLINVSIENFPLVEATFERTDNYNRNLILLDSTKVSVNERGTNCPIVNIINPVAHRVPLSVVIVVDVSGSMGKNRLPVAKIALLNLIKIIPLDISEIALISFNNRAQIGSDFTQDKNKLTEAVQRLYAKGGTSYTHAMLDSCTGAMPLLNQAQANRKLIFITDGKSDIDTQSVLDSLNALGTTVYAVSIGIDMPNSLKEISNNTGGKHYVGLDSEVQLTGIMTSILREINYDTYYKVQWKSEYGCDTNRYGQVQVEGSNIPYTYRLTNKLIPKIFPDVKKLEFGEIKMGSSETLPIKLINKRGLAVLSGITSSDPSYRIGPPIKLPDTLLANSTTTVPVQFNRSNEGLSISNIVFRFNRCPDKQVITRGGSKEKIKLTFPSGGEELLAQSDTLIKWEGIKPKRQVKLFYRPVSDTCWNYIGQGAANQFTWQIPQQGKDSLLVKAQPVPILGGDYENFYQNNLDLTCITGIAFSSNDSLVAISNCNGDIVLLNCLEKRFIQGLRGYPNTAIGFNELDQLMVFNNTKLELLKPVTGMVIRRLDNSGKVATNIRNAQGEELLCSFKASNRKSEGIVIYSPVNNTISTLKSKELPKFAGANADGTRAVTLSPSNELAIFDLKRSNKLFERKFSDVKQVILDRNSKYALVEQEDSLTILDLELAEPLFWIAYNEYKSFSPDGKYLINESLVGWNCFTDSYTGKELFTLDIDNHYISQAGHNLVYYENDTLRKINLLDKVESYKKFIPNVIKIISSGDMKRALLINSSGTHKIVDLENGSFSSDLKFGANSKYIASFSKKGKDLLLLANSGELSYWRPQRINYEAACSEPFVIVKPQISGPDTLYVGKKVCCDERSYTQYIKYYNKTAIDINIESITLRNDFNGVYYIRSRSTNVNLPGNSNMLVEIDFKPTDNGTFKADLELVTKYDIVKTHIYANAYKNPCKKLNQNFYLGRVNVGQLKDTIINIGICNLDKTGGITFKNDGNDTVQIKPLNGKLAKGPTGDSLRLKLRLEGVERGRTSTIINAIHADSSELFTALVYGDIVASRNQHVKGVVFDCKDSLAIKSDVEFTDLETGYLHKIVSSDSKGGYLATLNKERNYLVVCRKPGYLPWIKEYYPSENYTDTVKLNIAICKKGDNATLRFKYLTFAFDSDSIMKNSQPELKAITKYLRQNTHQALEIHGHTDNTGSSTYNQKLSFRRASAVKKYLTQHGIKATRIKAFGWGAKQPVQSNDTEAGRAVNRRVEIKFK